MLDQILGIVIGSECEPRRADPSRRRQGADADRQKPATMQGEGHLSVLLEASRNIFSFLQITRPPACKLQALSPVHISTWAARRKASLFNRTDACILGGTTIEISRH